MTSSRVSPPAGRLFLRACSVAAAEDWRGQEGALRDLADEDWRSVVRLAAHHGFAGLLGRNLAWAAESFGVVVPILEDLSLARRHQLVLNVARKAAAREIADALAGSGIPFALLKGVPLGEEVYGDLSLRAFWDCDVLVPPGEVESAYRAMVSLGYSLTKFGHVGDYVRLGAHAAGMARRDGMSVDLHWAIATDAVAPSQMEAVWRHCVPAAPGASLGGLRLTPEMTLIHLAKHFHSHQYTVFKPLLDFHVAASRFGDRIDSARLAAAARDLRLLPVLDIAAAVAARVFASAASIAILGRRAGGFHARVARLIVSDDLVLNGWGSSRIGNWCRYLLAAGGARASARSLGETLVPGELVLVQFFDRPYEASMYPKYYWRQAVKVLTLSSK